MFLFHTHRLDNRIYQMNFDGFTQADFLELQDLAKKRDFHQSQVALLNKQLAEFVPSQRRSKPASSPQSAPTRSPRILRVPRGQLQVRVIEVLKKYSPSGGLSIREIAHKISTGAPSVTQFIYVTGKKHGITKVPGTRPSKFTLTEVPGKAPEPETPVAPLPPIA